jgi:hypothetical protein
MARPPSGIDQERNTKGLFNGTYSFVSEHKRTNRELSLTKMVRGPSIAPTFQIACAASFTTANSGDDIPRFRERFATEALRTPSAEPKRQPEFVVLFAIEAAGLPARPMGPSAGDWTVQPGVVTFG